MSGIYIPGMGMPKEKGSHEIKITLFVREDGTAGLWGTEIYIPHEPLTLIPVPDHGGLVEKQKVVQKVYDYCHTADDKYCGPDDVGELWEEMQAMPTIIPADKEGEG